MLSTHNMPEPIYICGPTASGKSAVAIALAQRLNGEVVNADAYQIYRGIDILSAAPDAAERASVPHHLFSLLDPTHDELDAQRFRDLALPIIADISQRGKTPIVVGGSGMYLKFLTHGPSPVPSSDPNLRAELETRCDDELIDQLRTLDPTGAEITNLKNRRYLIRALEICLLSGQPMSQIKTTWKTDSETIERNLRGALLQWETDVLRQRIAQRTKHMLSHGAIEEIQNLPTLSRTCEKAIGVPQIRAYLANEIDLVSCEQSLFTATCRYAKRQRTWFRKETWLKNIAVDYYSTPFSMVEHLLETHPQWV